MNDFIKYRLKSYTFYNFVDTNKQKTINANIY